MAATSGLAVSSSAIQQRVNARRALERLLASRDRVKALEIGAGNEGRAVTDQHDGVDAVVGLGTLDRVADLFTHAFRERVDRWVVDGDHGHPAPDFSANELGHVQMIASDGSSSPIQAQ